MHTKTAIQTENFPLRPYFKYELAEFYHVSRRTFVEQWIVRFPDLIQKLENYGYASKNYQFTLKQVEILFEHLGEPSGKTVLQEKVPIKNYTIREISDLYNWSIRSFRYFLHETLTENEILAVLENKKTREINRKKRYFSVKDVEIIFKRLGHPRKRIKKHPKNLF